MKKVNKEKAAAQARRRAAHNLKRKGVTYDATKQQRRLEAVTEKRTIAL